MWVYTELTIQEKMYTEIFKANEQEFSNFIPTFQLNMRIYILIFSFFFSAISFAQTEKKYTPEQLQSDFGLMIECFLNIHPASFEFITQDSLKKIENSLRSQLNRDMTEIEFQVILRKYIRHVGCGHTVAMPSKGWYAEQKKKPNILALSYYLVGNELYINKAYRADSILIPGTRIMSINGMDITDLLAKMREIQERDGLTESFVTEKIEKTFSTLYLLLFGNSESYLLSYLNPNGEEAQITIEPGVPKDFKKEVPTKSPGLHSIVSQSFWIDTLHPNLGVMDLDAFPRKDFKKFYKKVFSTLEEKKIEHLVIDVRGNGGGYFPNGNMLLSYLMPNDFEMKFSRPRTKVKKNKNLKLGFFSKMSRVVFNTLPDKNKADPQRNYAIRYKRKKKNHFDGKVYLLTDGYSFSLSGMIPTILKSKAGATIVGRETGGGENGSYAILSYNLMLPETQVRVVLPHYFMDHDVSPELFGHGLMPNFVVPETIKTMLSPEDEDMEKVYELIQKR